MITVSFSTPGRGLFCAVAVLGATMAFASTAHAGEVVLWACHGPAGQPLDNASSLVGVPSGNGIATTYGSGCAGQAGSVGDGGVVAELKPSPPATTTFAANSFARWFAYVPSGTALDSLTVTRATGGFGGGPQPGNPLLYRAQSSTGPLESAQVQDASNVPLSGTATFAPAAGDWAYFGVECDAAPGTSCTAPSGGSLAAYVSAVALGVHYSSPQPQPTAAVGGVVSPVTGPEPLTVRASEDGLGLEKADAYLDNRLVAEVPFGGTSCAPLDGGPPGTLNLPLGADCPTSVTDVPLTVATAGVPDGPHQLNVVVTDIAGNTAILRDFPQTINVLNHPVLGSTTAVLTIGTNGGGQSGAGGTAGSSESGGGAPPCESPQLRAVLRGRPYRSAHGVPVLWQGTRYLFTGRLTCVVDGRRVGAAPGTVIHVQSLVGRRVVPHTDISVYSSGHFRILLHPFSTRVIEFFYGDGADKRVVHIYVRVVRLATDPHRVRAGHG